MHELTYDDYATLIGLIDDLPEDECHPKTLDLRERLVFNLNLLINGDS